MKIVERSDLIIFVVATLISFSFLSSPWWGIDGKISDILLAVGSGLFASLAFYVVIKIRDNKLREVAVKSKRRIILKDIFYSWITVVDQIVKIYFITVLKDCDSSAATNLREADTNAPFINLPTEEKSSRAASSRTVGERAAKIQNTAGVHELDGTGKDMSAPGLGPGGRAQNVSKSRTSRHSKDFAVEDGAPDVCAKNALYKFEIGGNFRNALWALESRDDVAEGKETQAEMRKLKLLLEELRTALEEAMEKDGFLALHDEYFSEREFETLEMVAENIKITADTREEFPESVFGYCKAYFDALLSLPEFEFLKSCVIFYKSGKTRLADKKGRAIYPVNSLIIADYQNAVDVKINDPN